MKKLIITIGLAVLSIVAFSQDKLITKSGHAKFFSHTVAEDIQANNYKVISSITLSTGELIFSIPMQSFEFEKSLMQKHYNSPKFLDTKQFPKAKFKGAIKDMSKVDFTKDGEYSVLVSGSLTMHGETKELTEKGTITIKGGKVSASSTFNITLADYKIAFAKGKPSTNIAKTVEVTINVNY